MHKIDGAGHVDNNFVAEDAATNRPATEFTADWFNAIQEELVNVILPKLGLDKNNNSQLLTAINMMIADAVNGGDYKQSVRVATTAAINLAAPGASIDTTVMVLGDRFLDKDNATLALRGIYIWNGAAAAATRATDADTGAELNGGAIIPVTEGTVNADTNWQITNDGTVTIGTTGLTFQQIGASIAGVAVGTIIEFSGSSAPTGYLACPLTATNVSRTTYAELFAAIGTTWGVGDGATTFGLPYFPADYASIQANANVGTTSVGAVIAHTHTIPTVTSAVRAGGAGDDVVTGSSNTGSTGGAANFAAGVRVLRCVKY